ELHLHREPRRRLATLRRGRVAYAGRRSAEDSPEARRHSELRRRPALDPALPVSTALITGGSAGIGLSIAERLLEKGYEVIALDVQPPKLAKVKHIQVDLADTQATEKAVKGIKATTLIHNAGVIRPALLPDVKLDDFDALVNLHLAAPVILMQALLPAMKAASYGRVVLVSSRAVLGLPTRTSYSA